MVWCILNQLLLSRLASQPRELARPALFPDTTCDIWLTGLHTDPSLSADFDPRAAAANQVDRLWRGSRAARISPARIFTANRDTVEHAFAELELASASYPIVM